MEEKIVLKLEKSSILSKKTNERIECVYVEIYASERPDEYIAFNDFKLKIPFNQIKEISVDDISQDDFNRYVLDGYCLPNAYSYGLHLLLDRIEERRQK
jgi:hypothetical protein